MSNDLFEGAAGLGRMSDYLRAYPEHRAVLLSVELCSLTLERHETSMADYIAAGLFAAGAAAVVGLGAQSAEASPAPKARIVDNHSAFFHDTEWVMGWDIDSNGFGLVLSGDLPEVIDSEIPGEVDGFLASHDLSRDQIETWISHPGGPKVLEAIADALGLEDDELEHSWGSLAEVGNLSSASVLHVLEKTLSDEEAGFPAVLMAMGPGFSAELLLLE